MNEESFYSHCMDRQHGFVLRPTMVTKHKIFSSGIVVYIQGSLTTEQSCMTLSCLLSLHKIDSLSITIAVHMYMLIASYDWQRAIQSDGICSQSFVLFNV